MKLMRNFFLLTSLAFMVSCGGGEKKKEEKQGVKIGASKESKKVNDNEIQIGLTGNDLMQFNKKELKAKAGQKVTLTLRHVGKQELAIMGHNFVLLQPGVDISVFAAEAGAAGKDKDWIPNDGKDVIAHTKMIGGGQSTSITFTAPEAGTYDFICSFFGHSSMMRGKFIVE